MRAGDNVGDELRFNRVGNARFENADDDGGARASKAVEADRLADDARIGLHRTCPEPVGQYHGSGSLWTVVVRTQEASEDRPQTHDVEIIAVHNAAVNFTRLAEADHREIHLGKRAERGDGLQVFADVVDFGNGEGGVIVTNARSAFANVKEAVFVAVSQRPEQHPANHAENGGVRADPQSQSDSHRQPQCPGP